MKISYEIGGRTLTLRATVYTWFAYKSQFGHELGEDLKRAMELDELRKSTKGSEGRLFLERNAGCSCRYFGRSPMRARLIFRRLIGG